MLVNNNELKLLFIHVPKCGGQSVEATILKSLGKSWEERSEFLLRPKRKGERGPKRFAHLTLQQYIDHGWISLDEFSSYTSFTIVRDPYARVISTYKFLSRWRYLPFSIFVQIVLPKLMSADNNFFVKPQVSYIRNSHGCNVSKVFRLEHVSSELPRFLSQAMRPSTEITQIVNRNQASMKRHSFTAINSKDYSSVIGKQNIRAINNLYAEDFEYFGFKQL